MKLSREQDIRRMEIWLEAWIGTAQASNCVKISTPTEYADACLKEFDKRFKYCATDEGGIDYEDRK